LAPGAQERGGRDASPEMELRVAQCFKKRRDMLELAANIGVGFLRRVEQGQLPGLPVKDANVSFKDLLIPIDRERQRIS
jgi:hypothetical protein